MLGVMHQQFGEPADVLAVQEASLPEPAEGEVRIKTILTPIHNHDLWTVRGRYGYKPQLPAIGGSEAVGIIDAAGPGVTVAIGNRVAVAGVHGSWAEYFIASASGLVPLPDVIKDEAAAQLIAMPFSAITLLDSLGVEAGDWIIQNTANGAVGKAVAMLAKSRGVHVVNLVRRDAGIEELAALGIEHVVSTAAEGWKDRVREITGDAPLRAAVDSIGGHASGELIGLLGENGLLVSFGTMLGEPMQIPSGEVIFKQLIIKGFWGAKVSASMEKGTRVALMSELIRLVATGELQLPVEAIYSFDQIEEAVKASLAPGKVGKVLLRP